MIISSRERRRNELHLYPSDVQLPDGSYTVVYEAVDSADNLTADSYTFWIDGTPPP